MMTPKSALMRLAAALLLIGLLSGCALGARRLRNQPPSAVQTATPTAAAAQTNPTAPVSHPTPTDPAQSPANPTAAADPANSAQTGADPSGDALLQQLNTLEAANAAADGLEDLP